MDVFGFIISLLLVFDVFFNVDGAMGRTNRKRQGRRGRKPGAPEKESSGSLRERYGKKDPPTLDRPTEVKLGIYINSFHSISEQTMDFMISFYLRQSWIDPRLQFTPVNGTDQIHASYETVDLIWTPDVFFRNEKRAAFHHVTQPNILMRINSNGGVWFVRKISAKLACPMDLQKYPMDKQTCPMMFESFGYTMDTMYFSWLDNPVDIDKSVELPQFTLETYELYDCSQNYTAGAFPCLEIKFVLQRAIGFFLIQVYIPSILIVILSWVSFWISIDAIPARVSLGLLTVLTMTTQSTSANNSLPKVSYIKAIDVWMSMCLVFVFIALLEFALVNVISRKGVRTINPARRPPPPPPPQSSIRKLEADGHTEQMGVLENGRERRSTGKPVDPEGKIKARKIDKLSRKIFPLAFLLFNIVYWIIYAVPDAL